ncbi:hypothetical protein MHBO_004167 [Bonamia ostreae]|uniref:Uncharacterized protein n=1 Tax=Bonamia ostreae TaxID=126728 RepID=A0ABV2ASK5_9EUKA
MSNISEIFANDEISCKRKIAKKLSLKNLFVTSVYFFALLWLFFINAVKTLFDYFPRKRKFFNNKSNYVFEVNLLIRSFSTYLSLGLTIIVGKSKDFVLYLQSPKMKCCCYNF